MVNPMTQSGETPGMPPTREPRVRYAVVPWLESRPNLPLDVGYALLAEPSSTDRAFGLFRIDFVPEAAVPSAEPVSEALDTLLESAERYPPAMGLMRDAIKHRCGEPPSRARFLWRVERLVSRYLADQGTSPYFLARSKFWPLAGRREGGWYWLVAHSRSTGRVWWVTDFTWIHESPVATFDVEPERVARLPEAPVLHWPDDDETGPA